MLNSHRYYAETVSKFLEYPILNNTVLFIESYDSSAHGNCNAICREMINDERFKDWNFIWVLPNATYYDVENLYDDRIKFVIDGSVGFVEACQTAEIIVTATYLPTYYVKRKEQMVLGCFPVSFYKNNDMVEASRSWLQITLENIDILYANGKQYLDKIDDWYPKEKPFHVIEGDSPRMSIPASLDADVLVSISKRLSGKSFSSVEAIYKECHYITTDLNKKLFFRVEKSLHTLIQSENEPEVLSHIVSEAMTFPAAAKNAEVVITNNHMNAKDAVTLGIPCIMISKTMALPTYFTAEEGEKLYFAETWENAINMLYDFYDNYSGKSNVTFSNDVNKILDAILNKDYYCNNDIDEEVEKELWIIPGDAPYGFWKCMNLYNTDKQVSILIRSTKDGRLWKKKYQLSENKKVFCKEGSCLPDEEGIFTEDICKQEWQRIVGNQRFDTIYAYDKTNKLWEALYENCPTDNINIMSNDELAEILYRNIMQNASGELSTTTIDGEEYYVLQSCADSMYCLNKKQQLDDFVVCFIRSNTQRLEQEEQIYNDTTGTAYVIVDPHKFMQDSKILKENNVYWIPKNVLPLRLLVNAKEVNGYIGNIIFGKDLEILV